MDYYEPFLTSFTNTALIQLECNIAYYFENFTTRQPQQNKTVSVLLYPTFKHRLRDDS